MFTLFHHYTVLLPPGLFQGGPFASDPTEAFPSVWNLLTAIVVVADSNQLMLDSTFGLRVEGGAVAVTCGGRQPK